VHTLDYFVPEDKGNDDTEYYTQARLQSQLPVDTNDKGFTIEEIRNAIGTMGNKEAPGEIFRKAPSDSNTRFNDIFRCKYYLVFNSLVGDRVSTVVKQLRYKSEGRWFDPRWCH
jgi:hypothetical protein